jgi:general secretion pathway protein G
LSTASQAVFSYRADHNGDCPRALADVVKGGYVTEMPIDAWGRPLRLTCPGRRDPQGFDISSDGPDGEPGGLDRVE